VRVSGHTITPHVVVRDAAKAVDWYTNVLGAEERLWIPVSDGRLMPVELRFGDSAVTSPTSSRRWGWSRLRRWAV
jgi:uncharacterized glyoxalase superfamily protein PhnB